MALHKTHVFHRHLHHVPPVAVRGSGVFIVDADGKEYLDASGGAAVSCLGHGHPDVIAAMHEAIDRLAYAHTSFFTSEPAEALADQLIRTAPAGRAITATRLARSRLAATSGGAASSVRC